MSIAFVRTTFHCSLLAINVEARALCLAQIWQIRYQKLTVVLSFCWLWREKYKCLMFGMQIEEVAQSSGASCRGPLSLPNPLIIQFSEEMSSYSSCQHSRCSADVFGEVSSDWKMDAKNHIQFLPSWLNFLVPMTQWFTHLPPAEVLTLAWGRLSHVTTGAPGTRVSLCLWHKTVSGIMKKTVSMLCAPHCESFSS